ncbi:unnamed protein product, partial [Amoebophrya sp. A120]|eukprot:GSA120T00020888001.1
MQGGKPDVEEEVVQRKDGAAVAAPGGAVAAGTTWYVEQLNDGSETVLSDEEGAFLHQQSTAVLWREERTPLCPLRGSLRPFLLGNLSSRMTDLWAAKRGEMWKNRKRVDRSLAKGFKHEKPPPPWIFEVTAPQTLPYPGDADECEEWERIQAKLLDELRRVHIDPHDKNEKKSPDADEEQQQNTGEEQGVDRPPVAANVLHGANLPVPDQATEANGRR